MKVIIAGGKGFLGSSLRRCLAANGHEVWVLTRRAARDGHEVQWDGRSLDGWAERVGQVDGIVNATGFGLEHWPWTAKNKRRFVDSRVDPGMALAVAVAQAPHKPSVFVQISGINYYGATGDGIADESYAPASDFLAQLTVKWEAATQPIEDAGVRRIVARSAVILDRRGGLFPLMALPVRLWAGGPLGSGKQAVPWIHARDEVEALRFLLEHQEARGAFNLIAPQPTSNADFMRGIARSTRRPYWLHTPGALMKLSLGEMSTLILDGRYAQPKRLQDTGYEFHFPTLQKALDDLFARASDNSAG